MNETKEKFFNRSTVVKNVEILSLNRLLKKTVKINLSGLMIVESTYKTHSHSGTQNCVFRVRGLVSPTTVVDTVSRV